MIYQQFLRFCLVGLTNTALDIGILNLLTSHTQMPLLMANTIAFCIAVTNSFFWNKYWTFSEADKDWKSQIGSFFLVAIIGLGLSNLIIYLFTIKVGIGLNLVKILSIAVVFLWNFLAPKFLIFRK